MRIIIGSPDGEMSMIERLARRSVITVVWATVSGEYRPMERVRSHEALLAKNPTPRPGDVWVECRPAGFSRDDLERRGVVCIDHHQTGDEGVAVPPEEFLRGSSLGQVLRILAKEGRLEFNKEGWQVPAGLVIEPGTTWFEGGVWWIACLASRVVAVPEEFVLVAAADHCLSAAYAGRCPGVDPQMLWSHRLNKAVALCNVGCTESDWTWQTPTDLEGEWDRELATALEAPRARFGDQQVLDLRGWYSGAAAGESLSRAGVPYVFSTWGGLCLKGDPTGEAVEAFICWARNCGFTEIYGSPERGFAGVSIT